MGAKDAVQSEGAFSTIASYLADNTVACSTRSVRVLGCCAERQFPLCCIVRISVGTVGIYDQQLEENHLV